MYIGIDIGGTNIKFGLVDQNGQILTKSMIPTNHQKEIFLEALSDIILDYQQAYPEIKGVGISAPGIIQKNGLMLTAGAIKPLYGTNLKQEIERRTKLPTFIENDANAAAIAEKWIGNAQELSDYICLVLGTGIGGGIIINDQVYRGAHGMAGEFGWMMIDELPEKENLEVVSLNQRAAIVGGLCHQYALALQKHDSPLTAVADAKEILTRAADNEPIAVQVLQDFYQDLAVGLMNLISCFDPEAILIGGGISENETFMKELLRVLDSLENQHESICYLKGKTIAPIIPAKLKNDAGMIGAVYQIASQLAQSPMLGEPLFLGR